MGTPRAASLLSAPILVCALIAGPAGAQPTAASEAERLNDEGKRFFAQENYELAYQRFAAAAERSPEGRYYFNLCFTLNFLGRYLDAIAACEEVEKNGADPELLAKTDSVLAALRDKAQTSAPPEPRGSAGAVTETADRPVDDAGTVDPMAPVSAPASASAGRPPPPTDPFALASEGWRSYSWALGADLGGVANIGVGDAGDGMDYYGGGGVHFRLYGNVVVLDKMGVGVQTFLGFSDLTPGDFHPTRDRLRLFDIGIGAFWHLATHGGLSLTPVVAAFASLQRPYEAFGDIAVGPGLRLEAQVAYPFGEHGQHAATFTPSLNVYFPSSATSDTFESSEFGLDERGSTLGITVGYQYRFQVPFGVVPVTRLE